MEAITAVTILAEPIMVLQTVIIIPMMVAPTGIPRMEEPIPTVRIAPMEQPILTVKKVHMEEPILTARVVVTEQPILTAKEVLTERPIPMARVAVTERPILMVRIIVTVCRSLQTMTGLGSRSSRKDLIKYISNYKLK